MDLFVRLPVVGVVGLDLAYMHKPSASSVDRVREDVCDDHFDRLVTAAPFREVLRLGLWTELSIRFAERPAREPNRSPAQGRRRLVCIYWDH
jgi:hypothetical protein